MRYLIAFFFVLSVVSCDSGNPQVDNNITISNGQSQDQDQSQNDVEGSSACVESCEDGVITTTCGGAEVSQEEVGTCPGEEDALDQSL